MSENQDKAKTLVTTASTQMKETLGKNKSLSSSPVYKQAQEVQQGLEKVGTLLGDTEKLEEAKTQLTTANASMLKLLDENKAFVFFSMYKEAKKVQKSVAEALGLL